MLALHFRSGLVGCPGCRHPKELQNGSEVAPADATDEIDLVAADPAYEAMKQTALLVNAKTG